MTGAPTRSIGMRRAQPGLAASKGRAFGRLCGPLLACVLAALCVGLTPWQPAFGQAQTSLEQISFTIGWRLASRTRSLRGSSKSHSCTSIVNENREMSVP